MYHLCFLCLVFLMLSRLFIAALWLPAVGLTPWLLLVMFIVFLLLSDVVSWLRCDTCLYRFLIFAVFLTFINRIHTRYKLQETLLYVNFQMYNRITLAVCHFVDKHNMKRLYM